MALKKPSPFIVLPASFLLLILAACTATPSPTATLEATQTVAPEIVNTSTATPEPAVVWLITGTNSDSSLRDQVEPFLTERAPTDGFSVEVHETFSESAIPGGLRIALFLSTTEDVVSLAGTQPDTQFVVFSDGDFTPTTNLSIIRKGENQAVFLAGYLATLNAPDFRSGALVADGAANTSQVQDSFSNGGHYFCGRCAPVYAPIVLFPQVGLVPAGADAAAWQAAFDALNLNVIETLFVPSEGLLPELMAYLAGKNVGIISNAPPPAGSESMWVATVQSNVAGALASIWPAMTAGEGGKTVPAELVLTHVNGTNLSPGRQQLAERIIPDLIAGIISPLSVP